MDYIDDKIRKSYSDHFKHFKQRLRQRYKIDIDRIEYELLPEKFHGLFKKKRDNTIGWVMIGDVKVWALYNKDIKCLSTCYPSNIETDIEGLLYTCFGSAYRHVGRAIYNAFEEEYKTVRKEFEDDKEAAIWYFDNTLFPTLHIDKYKHGTISVFKIMEQIRHVMLDNSPYLKLTVTKQLNKQAKEEQR